MQNRGAVPSAQAWKLGCQVMYPVDKAVDWGGHHCAVSWEGDDAPWRWLSPSVVSGAPPCRNFRKDFPEQQEMEKERPGSCWICNPKSQKCSSTTSCMTGLIPHPDGLVKPVGQHVLTEQLSSCLLTTLLELCLHAGVERFKFPVRGHGRVGRRLSGHSALLPGARCILCLIREHVLGDKDLASLFTKSSTNHIRRSSRSYYFTLQALPCVRPGPRWWWY